ncbi:MAG: hypothetical protein IPL77_18025 [Flavobacteriales bacterium]|nr:hypothetical protein [Flavobacteriales bacterium]
MVSKKRCDKKKARSTTGVMSKFGLRLGIFSFGMVLCVCGYGLLWAHRGRSPPTLLVVGQVWLTLKPASSMPWVMASILAREEVEHDDRDAPSHPERRRL